MLEAGENMYNVSILADGAEGSGYQMSENDEMYLSGLFCSIAKTPFETGNMDDVATVPEEEPTVSQLGQGEIRIQCGVL